MKTALFFAAQLNFSLAMIPSNPFGWVNALMGLSSVATGIIITGMDLYDLYREAKAAK